MLSEQLVGKRRRMTIMIALSFCLFVLHHAPLQVNAFAARSRVGVSRTPPSVSFLPTPPFPSLRVESARKSLIKSFTNPLSRMKSSLLQSSYLDGSNGRGFAILALAMSVCVWLFSIPPQFRREHICTVNRCVEDRSKCYDCVTFGEWKDQITQYYRDGGGVNFDFTVDPETLKFWATLKE